MAITIAGKADNTLVKMSALAEMADKPADTSAVSDALLESYGQFMVGMGKVYDNEMAKLEAEKKPLEDVFGKVISEVSNGTYTNEEITQVQGYIDQLREQYKAIPRGKKGETQRQQLQARINKFYNSYEAGGGENLTYAQLIANGEYDANNMEGFIKGRRVSNAESMEIFNKLGSKDYQLSFENDEKNYRIKLKSGETITVAQSELSGIFATDQPDAEGNYDTIDAFYKTLGQAEGSVWDPNEASNNIQKKVFTTDGAFAYIIKRAQGSATMSFHEALHKEQGFMTAEMFSTLGKLDPKLLEKYDTDGDGLDAGDFQNPENYKKLISTLTNTKDPDFNRKLAYKFAADWHAGKMKKSFDDGTLLLENQEKKKNTGGVWHASKGRSKRIENIIKWYQGELSLDELKLGKDTIIEKDGQFFLSIPSGANKGDYLIDDENTTLEDLILRYGYYGQSTKFDDAYEAFDFDDIEFGAKTASTDDGEEKPEGGKTTSSLANLSQLDKIKGNLGLIYMSGGNLVRPGDEGYEENIFNRKQQMDKISSYLQESGEKMEDGSPRFRVLPQSSTPVELFVQDFESKEFIKIPFGKNLSEDSAVMLNQFITSATTQGKPTTPKDVLMKSYKLDQGTVNKVANVFYKDRGRGNKRTNSAIIKNKLEKIIPTLYKGNIEKLIVKEETSGSKVFRITVNDQMTVINMQQLGETGSASFMKVIGDFIQNLNR